MSSCCGKVPLRPKVSAEQQKIINKVKKKNYGAVKRGRGSVSSNSLICINCNTIITHTTLCPICGHRVKF